MDFGEQDRFIERRSTGAGHDMLRQHIHRAGAEDFLIELAFADCVERSAGFEIFEAVSRDDNRLGRFIEPVIGAANALNEA